jgi:hypothetical protein
MQPSLIDIEHSRAVWEAREHAEPALAVQPPRARAATLLVRVAVRLDVAAARTTLALAPVPGRRP